MPFLLKMVFDINFVKDSKGILALKLKLGVEVKSGYGTQGLPLLRIYAPNTKHA